MVSYNCALDIDTAFLAGHHRRPRTAPVAWVDLQLGRVKQTRHRPKITSHNDAGH